MGNPEFRVAPLGPLFPGPNVLKLPADGRGAAFYRCSAVTPPCGEAVCGAGVGPAVVDGGIDFQTWPAIVAASILREYYR